MIGGPPIGESVKPNMGRGRGQGGTGGAGGGGAVGADTIRPMGDFLNFLLSSLPFILLVGDWAIRIILTPIVITRHRPAEATAWLLIIIFAPFAGLFVYLLLGGTNLGSRRGRRYGQAAAEFARSVGQHPKANPALPAGTIPKRHRDYVRLCQRVGNMPMTVGNHATLIDHTNQAVNTLAADIDAAQQHVHLLYFIVKDDTYGRVVFEALARAAERNVSCRLMVDAAGSRHFLRSRTCAQLRQAGVEVVAALPVNYLRNHLHRIDLRNHRKLAIIDAHIAHTGSSNLCDPTYGRSDGLVWRDVVVRLAGPIVHSLQLVFLEDWHYETGKFPDAETLFSTDWKRDGQVAVQAIPTAPIPSIGSFRDVTVSAIHEADKSVTLTTPYLVPDEPVIVALRTAALGGLDVNLVVPRKSDNRLVSAAARAYYAELLEAGVNIHEFEPGLLHAKTLTVDDAFAIVGSGNFDIRSFRLNLELTLLLFGESFTKQVLELQQSYMRDSTPIDARQWLARSKWSRLTENTAKLFGPVL